MIEENVVLNEINSIKNKIEKHIKFENFEDALFLISICSKLLYKSNLFFYDNDLENYIKHISKTVITSDRDNTNEDTAMFLDGFGLDRRGLANIYLKSLCKYKRIVYITYKDRKNSIYDIRSIIESNHGSCVYFSRKQSYLKQIKELDAFVRFYNPKYIFLYTFPYDVVYTTLISNKNNIIRYQINLTDHAFWLGSKCINNCIEFRDYGCNITSLYRNIEKEKIIKIPFYPTIYYNQDFEGFPFEKKEDDFVIFSGGSISKTKSKDNLYYKIIEYILLNYENVKFWYAGNGYSNEMYKISKKYRNRFFVTNERKDLLEVIKNCDLYLSTYPISGGLMFQYAALANKIPLTLKKDNETDGFLLNQENIGIEFDSVNDLLNEFDKLIKNDNYIKKKSANMSKYILTEKEFDLEIGNIFNNKSSSNYKSIEICTDDIIKNYLENMNCDDIIVSKFDVRHVFLSFKNFGIKTLYSMYIYLKEKILEKIL